MVAAKNLLTTFEEAGTCSECNGDGMVSYWNEVAYFEDRRACSRCELGSKTESKIADIVKRAQLEDRLSRK